MHKVERLEVSHAAGHLAAQVEERAQAEGGPRLGRLVEVSRLWEVSPQELSKVKFININTKFMINSIKSTITWQRSPCSRYSMATK